MKCCTSTYLLCLISLFILLNGCVSHQQSGAAADSDTNRDLKLIEPGICLEVKTGRMWQAGRSGAFYSLKSARDYSENLTLGGYSDWRLPTEDELFSLYYIFFWEKNGNCEMKRKGEYWISTVEPEPYPGHWETDFLCSPVHNYVSSVRKKGYVRAVRP